jgi:hypothetical protein
VETVLLSSGVDLLVSRSALRFVRKRYRGRLYVWPYRGEVPGWVAGSALGRVRGAPPGAAAVFSEYEPDGVLVSVAENLDPPREAEILLLDLRRRPSRHIVASWRTRPIGLDRVRDLANLLGWTFAR